MTSRAVAEAPGGTITVLHVEDEPDVRLVVSMVLRRAGFDVLEAVDGQQATAVLRDHLDTVDVVLMDVMMPVMTGPEALPVLRQLAPDLPVVFHSGYDRGQVAAHLSEGRPYTSFVPKPAENRALVEELNRAVATRR
ncbi:MAG: response regulator [Actinobacteria bacterium]|nr:response regulator [Actinomycetota bacterium]